MKATSKLVLCALGLLQGAQTAQVTAADKEADLTTFANNLINMVDGPAAEALKDVKVPKFGDRYLDLMDRKENGGLLHDDAFKTMC